MARGWLVVTGMSIVAGCALLTWSLWDPGQNGAAQATVLALPVGVLSLAVSMVSGWLAWRALQPVTAPDQVVRDLARAVRDDRQRFLDQALGVTWQTRPAHVTFTDPGLGSVPAAIESLLLNWQNVDGGEAGSIDDVADLYLRQPGGRLVVLGTPGAGKTVLLSRLVVDLIDRLGTLPADDLPVEVKVPVWLSLPACDLGDVQGVSSDRLAERLKAWISARLVEDYDLPPAAAAALVDGHRLLPVLDGLDEMDPVPTTDGSARTTRLRALAVLRALNASRIPVVLACRHLDYRTISQTPGQPAGSPPVLTDARHVMLQPLQAKDIIGYLTDRFHGPDGRLRARWQPLADALAQGEPLMQVLANPWQLFLAVTTYTQENSDPGDLLTMTPDQAEAHLLANLITAVVEHNDTAVARGWTAGDVQRWLTTIADHQHRTSIERGMSLTEIRVPELWLICGRRYPRWIPALIPAAGCLVFAGLTWTTGDLIYRVFSAALLTFGGVGFYFAFDAATPLNRLDWSVVHTSRGRRSIRNHLAAGVAAGVAIGVVAGVAIGVAIGVVVGLVSGLVSGLVIGLLFVIVYGLERDVDTAPSPGILVRQCVSYSLTYGLVSGLVGELGFGLAFGLVGGLGYGVAFGLGYGLAFGNGNVWLRYAIGVRSAARQDMVPRHVARFLDWALNAGLMRMAGNTIQFRHRQLQDWLTDPTGPHIK